MDNPFLVFSSSLLFCSTVFVPWTIWLSLIVLSLAHKTATFFIKNLILLINFFFASKQESYLFFPVDKPEPRTLQTGQRMEKQKMKTNN